MIIGLRHISKFFLSNLIGLSLVTSAICKDIYVQAERTAIDGSSATLRMRVWNCSDKKISFQLADLPWGQNTTGLVVFAAGKVAGEALPENMPIADFPEVKVTIPPASSVSGEIDLRARFLKLMQYKKFDDLVLFWVYDMSLLEGGGSRYVGGMLHFDSKKEMGSKVAINPCK